MGEALNSTDRLRRCARWHRWMRASRLAWEGMTFEEWDILEYGVET